MFNLLSKKISLEFLTNTHYAHAHEFFPAQRSFKFIPRWYKNTPMSNTVTNLHNHDMPEYFVNPTVKGCIGVQNMLTAGIVIPWWSDLQISVYNEGFRYLFSDTKSIITHHPNKQAPGFFEDYYFLKVESPWILRSSERIKYIINPYFYSDDRSDAIVLPAIGETLTRSNIVNLHFFLAIKKTKDFVTYNFKHNTPAIQIIPLTEKQYKISNSIVSYEEYEKYTNIISTPISKVNYGVTIRKLSKCPFHSKA